MSPSLPYTASYPTMRIHASLSRRMGPVIRAARAFPKRLRKIFKGRSSSCALIEVQTDELASTTPPTTPDEVVSLPQEIVDTIMECLGDNSEALRCYSVVCRSWHAATTRVLFRHLVIHTRNIEALDDIFYGSPHLVRHIRHLTFQLLPYTQRIEISRIRGVLHAVPGLQSVTLRLHSSNLSHSDSLGGEDTPSLTLRRLEITSELILMLYPATLTGLFSLFRSIDELSVCSEPHDDVVDILRNRLTGPPFNPPPPILPPLRVQRIDIREKCGDYGTVAILALLPCVADLGGITSLSLVAPIRFERLCASVSSFVEVAENIETISIAFNRNRTADGLFRGLLPSALDLVVPETTTPPDFSPCQRARRLRIGFDLYDHWNENEPYAQWDVVASQLQNAPTALFEVTFVIRVSEISLRHCIEAGPAVVSRLMEKLRTSLQPLRRLQAVKINFDVFGWTPVVACIQNLADSPTSRLGDGQEKWQSGVDISVQMHAHTIDKDDRRSVYYIRLI